MIHDFLDIKVQWGDIKRKFTFFVKPTIPSEVECARRVCKSCWTCSLPTDDDTDDVFVPTIQRTNRAQRCSFIKPLFFIYTQLSSFIRLKVLLISHLAWMAYNRHEFFFKGWMHSTENPFVCFDNISWTIQLCSVCCQENFSCSKNRGSLKHTRETFSLDFLRPPWRRKSR